MVEQKELKKEILELKIENSEMRDSLLELEMENAELKDMVLDLGGEYKEDTEERSDEWRISQFNRNRAREDQVSTIEEMEQRVKDMYDTKYIYESPDAGKTVTRRKFGDYDNKETLNN